MATGVPPREEDIRFSKIDVENIKDAMKSKKFRDMFVDYCNEVRDPANQALYQKEMTQLEKERGYDITFINPVEGYVIKTSVAGDRKAFINICSNENVAKPECTIKRVNGQKGLNWQIPYSLIPPRNDFDKKRQKCVVYDVVYHPDTLRMAAQNKQFRELVNKTAFDALKNNYNVHLDNNNFKFPKSAYKGMATPGVIRKEDPNYEPPTFDENESLPPEVMDKLYPQKNYNNPANVTNNGGGDNKATLKIDTPSEPVLKSTFVQKKRRVKNSNEYALTSDNGYTIPKYVIKQQKNVDLQDFTYHKDCKLNSAIPSQIVVEVHLPLLSSTSDCTLDVQEKSLSLKSEQPAKYKLSIPLPYPVNESSGNAKFDKTKRKLIVSLPVLKTTNVINKKDIQKIDSGVESEDNSESQSDDEGPKNHLIEELPTIPEIAKPDLLVAQEAPEPNVNEDFFSPSLGYLLPAYTHNVLDETIAFTFHVKNTEPESVNVTKTDNKIFVKFTSIGAGFVPTHYGAIIVLDEDVVFHDVTGEAWDNNVILQFDFDGNAPTKFMIGLSEDTLSCEQFDLPISSDSKTCDSVDLVEAPSVKVQNTGEETNIVLMSNDNSPLSSELNTPSEEDPCEEEVKKEKEIIVVETETNTNAKSILRKAYGRSYSESESVGDIASSMDCFSSDCIPDDSSLKKTVRFNDVIAKQFYRYNSSIEGQKKKNQRKKNKKKSLERRKSESEAEDDGVFNAQHGQTSPRSGTKMRRDSGLSDTSDAETDRQTDSNPSSYEPQPPGDGNSILNIVNQNSHEPALRELEEGTTKKKEPKPPREPVKHNTELYDPDRLNKGQYLEVQFKNDLIFDLDM